MNINKIFEKNILNYENIYLNIMEDKNIENLKKKIF